MAQFSVAVVDLKQRAGGFAQLAKELELSGADVLEARLVAFEQSLGGLLRCAFETRMEMAIFTVVHYISVGILHVQLLLSHLSTEQLTAEEERAHGVFRAQLASTRNITSHWYSHWFHGGLEMQIEHHLFPQLPRHQLHAVAPRVRALAEKHGVAYVETGFLEALVHCLRDLRRLSTALATVDFI